MAKKHAKLKLLAGILLIVFGILVAGSVISQENRQNRENTVVVATVTSCVLTYEEYDIVDSNYDREYRIGVKYTYEGKEYESSVDYTSEKTVGKKIKIHINPDNPVETDGLYGGLTDYIATILFLAVPITLIGVLVLMSAFEIRKKAPQEA